MAAASIEIGVVVARRAAKSVWIDATWRPYAALPAAPALEDGALMTSRDGEETYFAGAHVLELHPAETAHYRDNLLSGRPSIWLALRLEDGRPRISALSVDPYEGEAMADAVGDVVEAVAMPESVERIVADFVARHHVERPFIKRKRNRDGGGRA
jgi:hypothetical protein